jgi:hypothetical protein
METIEDSPPKTIDESELERLAVSHPHPDTLPAPRGSFPILRVMFWAFLIFGAIVAGAAILALPKFTLC